MIATKWNTIFQVPFIAATLLSCAFALLSFTQQTHESLTIVLAVIAGVMLCGCYQMPLGPGPTAPRVGAGLVILAVAAPSPEPWFWAGIWALGFTASQIMIRRSLAYALYTSGVGILTGCLVVYLQLWLTGAGLWQALAVLITTAAYYLIVTGVESLRQRISNRAFGQLQSGYLAVPRLLSTVLITASAAVLMLYVDSSIIAVLEQDASINRTPFVALATAVVFYILAQRHRFNDVERQLRSVLDAAVELPHLTGKAFADALTTRARIIVHATESVITTNKPARKEIGAPVQLHNDGTHYLVAKAKLGGAQFTREDVKAIGALAQAASQAAAIRIRVDSLEHRANTDTLTGLPNYGAFQIALNDANANRPYHEGVALLFIDLDNFKTINDTYGHGAGDRLLKAVSQRLQLAAGGGDFVSRVGGDEFVVILMGLVSLDQAKESAERIVQAVSQPVRIEDHELRPVVSAGLSYSSHRELDPQTLVEDADRTMLHEKRVRRDAGSALSSFGVASHRSTRTNDIVARAIQENRLMLAFQPIVDLSYGRAWAHEALVRYVDPELGPISPTSLVARAKSLGLMNELTTQIITKALDAAEEFYAADPRVTCMTVNLELGQISNCELGSFLTRAAADHPNITLCIELNESSLRSATNDLRRDAEQLQADGIIIALDDYGSDDSSVRALVDFPMNVLKLDKSLVSDLSDLRQRELVKSLQSFGDTLHVTTIVEGVESEEMVETLRSLGVRNAQGYFYGRPAPAAVISEQLRSAAQQGGSAV